LTDSINDRTINDSNITTLLTGGTGYLGSHLLKRLLKSNQRVILLKRSHSKTFRIENELQSIQHYDIDKIPLEKVFQENRIDRILHCATHYGRLDKNPIQIVETNQVFPLQLLQYAEKYNVQSFINTDTILDKRVSTYSLSKRQFSEWLELYSEKMSCVNVALEHFYGPGDDRSKFVSFVIMALLENVDKIDLTEGEQRRDFIYIDDVVEAFLRILESNTASKPGFYRFEIGTGELISIKDLVLTIQKLSGSTNTLLNFGAIPYRENEIMHPDLNLGPIQKLGWTPRFPLTSGLKNTIDEEKRNHQL